MALKGDLASVDLAQVFQMLALNKKVGLLSIQSSRLWKVLYFDQRGVSLYFNEHMLLERVLAGLTRIGRLREDVLAETRDHAAQMGHGVVDTLLAGGHLTEEDIEEQTRFQMSEEIYDLFFCKDAKFEFFEGLQTLEGREGVVNERFFFNTDTVIMEAARRIDEWSYISERIQGPLEVFCPTGTQMDPAEFDGDCLAVFDLVDGKRNVSRMIEVSGMANFLVFKHLCQLLDGGFIETLPPQHLVEAGNQCLAEGRLPDAINLFEKAVGLGMGVPEVHSLAAEAYQASNEFENAIYHLKCDAEYRLAAGDTKGAVTKLRAAVAVVPTDLAARERLVELTVGNKDLASDGFDPIAEGKSLVDLFMEVGDLKRVRSVLERLLRVQPEDLDLKKVLVNVHTKAGDQKQVVELYEAIANDLVRTHRPLEAVGYLQKILMLDRSRTDVSEKVRALYEFDERRRSRRRSLATLGAVFFILVALGALYYLYDRQANAALERIDVRQLVEQNDFGQAAAKYEQFLADYPLTLADERAAEELARLDGLRQKHEAVLASDKLVRDRELAKIRADYRAEWTRHRQMFVSGNAEGSLAALQKVRDLVSKAGAPDDLEWALEQQIEKTYGKMQDFIEQAASLGKKVEQLVAAGEWQQAREAALKLLTEYDITQTAHNARIPVLISSRPKGARISKNGAALLHEQNGAPVPLFTPAIVLCTASGKDNYGLELEGFEPQAFTVDPHTQGKIDLVLKVVAQKRIAFTAPVQTGVGVAGNYVVAGLRGGKLGIARLDNGSGVATVDLGGLKAADSTPVGSGGRVFFLSNERTIECLIPERGTVPAGWPITLEYGAATEMVVQDGRLFVIDTEKHVFCFDQADGRRLWAMQLDGSPSGPPTVEKRLVRVGTTDGRVITIDAGDGRLVNVLRAPTILTTRVLAADGVLYFGCTDGMVRAVDDGEGRILWAQPVGRPPMDGEMVLTPSGVLVLGADEQLLCLQRKTGRRMCSTKLGGVLAKGMLVRGEQILVTLHRQKDEKHPAHDILQALDATDLTILWEFVDTGVFVGPVGVDGSGILLPDSNGEVVLFR